MKAITREETASSIVFLGRRTQVVLFKGNSLELKNTGIQGGKQ